MLTPIKALLAILFLSNTALAAGSEAPTICEKKIAAKVVKDLMSIKKEITSARLSALEPMKNDDYDIISHTVYLAFTSDDMGGSFQYVVVVKNKSQKDCDVLFVRLDGDVS